MFSTLYADSQNLWNAQHNLYITTTHDSTYSRTNTFDSIISTTLEFKV